MKVDHHDTGLPILIRKKVKAITLKASTPEELDVILLQPQVNERFKVLAVSLLVRNIGAGTITTAPTVKLDNGNDASQTIVADTEVTLTEAGEVQHLTVSAGAGVIVEHSKPLRFRKTVLLAGTASKFDVDVVAFLLALHDVA